VAALQSGCLVLPRKAIHREVADGAAQKSIGVDREGVRDCYAWRLVFSSRIIFSRTGDRRLLVWARTALTRAVAPHRMTSLIWIKG
jgi:hypothetical protein